MAWLAVAYDRAGMGDSATALFSRFVNTPGFERYHTGAMFVPMAQRHLRQPSHELQHARGR